MFLSRLEIFGFKTFAQKVDLRFEDGITNVVGPNGCGKSNVVDALRWSLGEQKSSVLRSEKMENVIFSGTKLRKPLNFSEVSVTIQNTRGVLPTEYTEVTITRRIYRSGESEYYLNRLPCRLKDINDLFMDTGMGADAYSVIELKMVEQILSDKTEDRRKLFEEAAGITKYKIRRRQTFNKLLTTKSDLTRANDIILEIDKKVNSLKRQTQKAKRYIKLSGELKLAEVQLAHHEYQKYSKALAPLSEKLGNLEFVSEQMLGDIAVKESQVEEMNTSLITCEQTLREIQLRLEDQDKRIKTIQDDVLIGRERKKNLEEMIRRYAEEKESLQSKKMHLEQRIAELKSSHAELNAQYEAMRGTVDSKKAEMTEFDHSLQSRRAELETIRKEMVLSIDEVAKKRNAFQLIKNNIQNLERKITDLQKESEFQSSETEDVVGGLDEKRYEKKKLSETCESLRQAITTLQTTLDAARHELDKARSERLHAEAEIKALNAKIMIVKKSIESHEGFPESVQFLLSDKPAGIQATIADMLSMDEKYKKAIEAALGDGFSYIVAGGMDSVKGALARLNQSKKGLATFINPEKLKNAMAMPDAGSLSSARSEFIGLAADLAKSEDAAIAKWLLGDAVIVDNFDKATSLAERFPQWRFVTLAGEIVKGNYLIRGGSGNMSNESMIGQRETLKHLESDRTRFENEIVSLTSLIQNTDEKIKNSSTQLVDSQNKLRQSEQTLVALDKEISQSEYEQRRSKDTLTRNESVVDQARSEMKLFQEQLDDLAPDTEALEEKRGTMELKARTLEAQLTELEKQRRERSEGFNEMISTFLRLEGEIKNTQSGVESSTQQITDTQETLARREEESRLAAEEITRLGETSIQHEENLIRLEKERDGIERERDGQESEVSKLRETTGKIEGDLKKMRRQREEFLNSRHTMEQETTNLRFEIRAIEERIKRDYDFDLINDSVEALILATDPSAKDESESESDDEGPVQDAASEAAPADASEDVIEKSVEEVLESDLPQDNLSTEFDPTTTKAHIDEVRRKIKQLGPVNMEAFVEYNVEKDRLDVLVVQRKDLLDAEAQLMETITTINNTAQAQFMEVFGRIRENFIKIFTGLFSDSEADLRLEANEDVLEASIEILARPTGKKIQHIALLSGGEKTLTAIALLFAIYLVKPSPFCILDEVDAPLDDTNIDKFTQILKDFSKDTQFIVVTHNKRTMEAAKNIFGITMQEAGVSKVVSVKFSDRDDVQKTDDIEKFIRDNAVEDLSSDESEPPVKPSGDN